MQRQGALSPPFPSSLVFQDVEPEVLAEENAVADRMPRPPDTRRAWCDPAALQPADCLELGRRDAARTVRATDFSWTRSWHDVVTCLDRFATKA